MKLSKIKIGTTAIITGINLDDKTIKRFAVLGLSIGTSVKVVGVAPLNSPIKIKVKNSYLAIRKSDADKITVKVYE